MGSEILCTVEGRDKMWNLVGRLLPNYLAACFLFEINYCNQRHGAAKANEEVPRRAGVTQLMSTKQELKKTKDSNNLKLHLKLFLGPSFHSSCFG